MHHHSTTSADLFDASHAPDEFVCWTKMQGEAGQPIEAIVSRKERERMAGDGLFMWGVGNAPAVLIKTLARLGRRVPVVFSLMKSKPKLVDTAPVSTLIWRGYIDRYGNERNLPANAIVTSRGTDDWINKRHYALMCYSPSPLQIVRGRAFDPNAYRNASGTGAPVGASQVTSLLRPVHAPSTGGSYEANLQAQLVDSYWVRLTDPAVLPAKHIARLADLQHSGGGSWLEVAKEVRNQPSRRPEERRLFI
jgi:hypothetical protein